MCFGVAFEHLYGGRDGAEGMGRKGYFGRDTAEGIVRNGLTAEGVRRNGVK